MAAEHDHLRHRDHAHPHTHHDVAHHPHDHPHTNQHNNNHPHHHGACDHAHTHHHLHHHRIKERDSSEDEICALKHINCEHGCHKHGHKDQSFLGHDCAQEKVSSHITTTTHHHHHDTTTSRCDHSHSHDHEGSHAHDHGHDCGHDHGSGIWAYLPHSHGLHERINADRASLQVACVILTVSLCVQVGGGMLVDSNVLEAEAVHTALDGLVLICSFLSIAVASWRTNSRYTYGYGRAEILSALISVLTLVLMCVQLAGGALRKLWHYYMTSRGHIAAVSANKGLAVTVAEALTLTNNILIALVLARNNSLNIRALKAHVIGDSVGNVVVLSAGALMWRYPQLSILDPLLTLIVVIAICAMNIPLAKETIEVLMQASPLNTQAIRNSLLDLPGIKRITNLHIWTLTSGATVASVKLQCEHNNSEEVAHSIWSLQKKVERQLVQHGVHQCTIQINPYQQDSNEDDNDSLSQGTIVENSGLSRVEDDHRYGLVGNHDDHDLV